MRLIFGILIGIGLTIGAAYLRDTSIPEGPSLPPLEPLASQRIVNWDVLGAVVDKQIDYLRGEFDRIIGG